MVVSRGAAARGRWPRGAVWLIAVLAVAACAGPQPASFGEPAVDRWLHATDLTSFALPLDPYQTSPVRARVTARAQLVLTERCLQSFGLRLPAGTAPAGSASGYERRYGIVDARAASTRGYHGPAVRSRPRTLAELSPAATRVLTGEGQRTYRGRPIPQGGCAGQAERDIAEGAPAVENAHLGEELAVESWERSKNDSRVRSVFARWSACMRSAGYDYTSPFAANDDPTFETPGPTAGEIGTAVSDVRCKGQADVVDTWASVETAYQLQAQRQHGPALEGLRARLEVLEKNAARVVTSG